MPYKPKYCCQCGEKIERINWNLNSSRRFCELCETEFKVHDLLPRIAVVCGILFGILGLGAYWQKPEVVVKNVPKQFSGASLNINKNSADQAAPQVSTNQSVQSLAQTPPNISAAETKSPIVSLPNGTKQSKIAPDMQPAEMLYYCGAQTKKGSPCSHKVKHPGRCWQHTGQPAMLPQEKLLVKQ